MHSAPKVIQLELGGHLRPIFQALDRTAAPILFVPCGRWRSDQRRKLALGTGNPDLPESELGDPPLEAILGDETTAET